MRVLILTSSTGGGHDMRANAFATWRRLMPELKVETRIYRPLETSHGLYRFGVELYNWIQKRAPFLHHLYFNFLELVAPSRSAKFLLGADKFRRALNEFGPDVLLSVHGSLNHAYFEIARTIFPRIRCVTYCGELFGGYGFSRNWVNPRADLFIGPVPETCQAAIGFKMPPERTWVGGFLLRPEFYESLADLPSERAGFVLLLSASSQGANNHIAFLEALQECEIQIKILCGNSTATRERVERWCERNKSANVQILPSDADIAALLRNVSAVVARPGVNLTSEAITVGCPLLQNCIGGTMPQENITVKFCRKHRVARQIYSPKELAHIVSNWKKNPAEMERIRMNMDATRPTAHPRDIVARIAALA